MNDYTQISKELQILLKKGRITQKISFVELARQTNISKGMLLKYENDINVDIPFTKLIRIIHALSIPKEDFLNILRIYL